jgi:nucleoside-diphosphate-sugar epimerase
VNETLEAPAALRLGSAEEAGALLILGAGYIGGALAQAALADGKKVVLADNWQATAREQVARLEAAGAQIETADIRRRDELDRLVAEQPARVYLLAAQASRLIADLDPDYTEETNVTGPRRVAEALELGPVPLVYASSLHVYGPAPQGAIGPEYPYGRQDDLSHLSKVYAELCLDLYARRVGFPLAILRLGIVYGPSPVEHSAPESQTVVNKFRRLAGEGRQLPLDDGGRATVGVVHIDDVTRIMLATAPTTGTQVANVVAETTTVADVAALARGERPAGGAGCTYESPFEYRHTLAQFMAS